MWVVSYEADPKKEQLPDECCVFSLYGSLRLLCFVPYIGKLTYNGDIIVEAKFMEL